MLITGLELQNFKSYAEANITFTPGTNAIIGSNGAGKTTLLEAIGFVLFNQRGQGLGGRLREGTSTGSVVVRLVSSLDEREYEVERCFSAKTTTRYRVYEEPSSERRIVAEGAEEVQAWLHEHLRVDAATGLEVLFESTVGVPQGTFTAPFLMAPTQRKATFDPLLQVDEYRRASDNLLETVRHLSDQSSELRQNIARLEERLLDLPLRIAEEQALTGTLAGLAARVEELAAALAETQSQVQTLDAAEDTVQQLAGKMQRVEGEVAGLRGLIQAAETQVHEAEQALEAVERSRTGHDAYRAAEIELRALESRRAARDELLRERAGHEREQASLAERSIALNLELASVEVAARKMDDLAPQVEAQVALEEALQQARLDATRLEEVQRQEAAARGELGRSEKELAAIQARLAQAQTLDASLNDMQRRLAELAEEDRARRAEQAAARAEIERLKEQSQALGAAGARCPVCEAELTPEHRAELAERNAGQLQELSRALNCLLADLQALGKEQKRLLDDIARQQRSLRALPTEEDARRAEAEFERRRQALESVRGAAAGLAAAPPRAEQLRIELAALGNPRQEFDGLRSLVGQREARTRELAEVSARQNELERRVQECIAALAAYAGLAEALQRAQTERERSQADYGTYLGNLNTAQQVEPRRARHSQLAADMASAQNRLADLHVQHTQAVARYDAERHTRLRLDLAQQQQAHAAAGAELREKQARLATVRQEIENLQIAASSLEVRRRELAECVALREMVESVRELLRKAGPYVTQQLVRRISRAASGIYGDIMADHTSRLIWSEDYDLTLEVKGNTRGFRQLSGGEQMAAALALRLALLRETSAVDVAFFDEPTANLDPERREGLAEKITQVKGFSQLFVISHDDTFERVAQNLIRIVKTERGSSWERD
ncbi:MAG: AAA family ATPase [Anaerolineae bacterium]